MAKSKNNKSKQRSYKQLEIERRAKKEAEARQRYTIFGIVGGVILLLALGWILRSQLGLGGGSEGSGSLLGGDRPLADTTPGDRINSFSSYPDTIIDDGSTYEATVVTQRGDIRVRLFADEAPLAVNSFVYLASQGYYDGTTFHRVLEDFMAQAGDPSGTGSGGPGYTFADEVGTGRTFDKGGLLAMANSGPATNGGQFFITYEPTPWLDGLHTIFGEVIEGEDVLDLLTRRDPNQSPAFEGDLIERIDIYEN